MADFDPRVTAIAAQPFLVTAPAERRVSRHVPDFLLVHGDGAVCVVNVKPADRLAVPKVAGALAWAGEVFAGRGWRHEIWSGAPPALLANVRFLSGYRHGDRVDAALAAEITRQAPDGWGSVSWRQRGRPRRVLSGPRCCIWCGGVSSGPTCRCRCRRRRGWSVPRDRAGGGDDHDWDQAGL
jgi:hypothetical protein